MVSMLFYCIDVIKKRELFNKHDDEINSFKSRMCRQVNVTVNNYVF